MVSTPKFARKFVAPLIALTASTSLVAGLGACSNNDSTGSNSSSDTVKVVASTGLWADVVKEVSGGSDKVSITGLIQGDSVDPHDYTPSSKDMAKISDANLIVGNGAGYDSWLTGKAPSSATVITALPEEEHDHDHGDSTSESAEAHDHSESTSETASESAEAHDHSDDPTNPHVWYDVEKVEAFAKTIADALNKKNPEIKASADEFDKKLDKINDRIKQLPQKNVAATEPVADYLIEESPMKLATPHSYELSALKESEHTASEVAEFTKLLSDHKIDVLVFNPQTDDSVSQTLKQAAKQNNVPIAEIYETPAENTSYIDFFNQAVTNLENAAKK